MHVGRARVTITCMLRLRIGVLIMYSAIPAARLSINFLTYLRKCNAKPKSHYTRSWLVELILPLDDVLNLCGLRFLRCFTDGWTDVDIIQYLFPVFSQHEISR